MNFAFLINFRDFKIKDQTGSVIFNNFFCIFASVLQVLGPIIIVVALKQSWKATDKQVDNMYLKYYAEENELKNAMVKR